MADVTRRIWSEEVPIEELVKTSTLEQLAMRSIQLIVAIQPSNLEDIPRLLGACGEAGVRLGIWPLLEDEHGRWPSGVNALRFRAHVLQILETLEPLSHTVRELVFDLEPPMAIARQVLKFKLLRASRLPRNARLDRTKLRFTQILKETRELGLRTTAVVLPMVLCDTEDGAQGWQQLMDTPIDGMSFDQVIVMAYTSLIEGYTRGMLSRRHARSLLTMICERARQRWGVAAAIALGIVGGGSLGDERPYRGIEELVEDVAVARAAGIEDLALFGMEGALRRKPNLGRWLDALVETEALERSPTTTVRARLSWNLAVAAGRISHAGHRALALGSRTRP